MHARLILTAGSRAGLVARIHEGVYLIGRDKMCQIRPKSRSVSRRHCAVFNDSSSIRVLDLGSTAGTLVNGEKIPERKRVEVFDGDQIRCGKISFSVAISASEETPLGSAFQASGGSAMSDSQTMVTGEAMRESDIADLLLNIDEAHRVERIASIRQRNEEAERQADITLEDDDEDADADDPLEDDEPIAASSKPVKSSESPRYKKLDSKTKRSLARRFSSGESGFDAQKLVLIVVSVAILLVFAWVLWSGYQMFFGTNAEFKDLDY
jgi:pSer/pThr/pTyr-binding forkhead associated (FHA) protein